MEFPSPPPGTNLSESQKPILQGVGISLWLVAFITVVLRFVSRRIAKLPYWIDDWLQLPAIFFAGIASLICVAYMVPNGFGLHIWVNGPYGVEDWFRGLYFWDINYPIVLGAVKFSILAFYWRIFKLTSIRIPIYILAGVTACWAIGVLLVGIFQCYPVSDYWEQFSPDFEGEPYCPVNTFGYFYGSSIPNTIVDFAILSLPIPYVFRLQLPLFQRICVSAIFCVGLFVTAVSIIRIYFLSHANITDVDVTWANVESSVWTLVELDAAIICSNLPALRALFSYYKGAKMSHASHDSRYGAKSSVSVSGAGSRAHRVFNSSKSGFETVEDENYLFDNLSNDERGQNPNRLTGHETPQTIKVQRDYSLSYQKA